MNRILNSLSALSASRTYSVNFRQLIPGPWTIVFAISFYLFCQAIVMFGAFLGWLLGV
ncbi:hypothetical protein [Spirosoma harenae]